jgi:hypothetical protein
MHAKLYLLAVIGLAGAASAWLVTTHEKPTVWSVRQAQIVSSELNDEMRTAFRPPPGQWFVNVHNDGEARLYYLPAAAVAPDFQKHIQYVNEFIDAAQTAPEIEHAIGSLRVEIANYEGSRNAVRDNKGFGKALDNFHLW